MDAELERGGCPGCGAREKEHVAGADDVRREVEHLWEFHLRRVHPGTPVRFLFDRTVFSQDPPLAVVSCRSCGTLYRDPREPASDLVDTYADEEVDAAVMRDLFEAQRRSFRRQVKRLRRFAGDAGAGLEVGSYTGAFLAAARDAGWTFDGVDVNAGATRFARSLGLHAHEGTLDDAPRGRAFDAVTIWNCFEQLPDPRRAARTARSLLRPGGTLAVRVPNGAFYAALRPLLDGPLAAAARMLLAYNNLLAFPYRAGFTPRSLARLLAAEGFRVIAVVGDVLVPIAGEHTRTWAKWEERALKRILRAPAALGAAPWMEVYARAVEGGARASSSGGSSGLAPAA